MKQKNKKSLLTYSTIVGFLVFLTGAQCTIGECSVTFNDYTAHAVNVKYTNVDTYWKDEGTLSLAGTSISLYPYDSSENTYSTSAYATTTVSSDGSFSFYSPEPNRYKLTGTYNSTSNNDWIFVPRYVEITNDGASSKDLYAFPSEGAGQYTVIASWETLDKDVDLSLTYGPDIDVTAATPWDTGFTVAPNDERYHIFYNRPGDKSALYHDTDVKDTADNDVPRVETMSVYSNAWLKDGDVIKFYLDAYNDDMLTGLEGDKTSAFAQVDLMNGSSHFGTWYIPWNTAENTLEIFYMVYDASGDGSVTVYSANYSDGFKGIRME